MKAPPFRRMPLAWHRQTEHEIAAMYAQGYDDGIQAARLAMDQGINDAVHGAHPTAKEVVSRLVRAMDAEAAKVRS